MKKPASAEGVTIVRPLQSINGTPWGNNLLLPLFAVALWLALTSAASAGDWTLTDSLTNGPGDCSNEVRVRIRGFAD